MPRDPVCGMNVEEGKNAIRSEYKGQTYYFCSARCRDEFRRNPEAYVNKAENNDRNRLNDIQARR